MPMRDDLPDFQCAKLGLDVNAGQIVGLSVDAQARKLARLRRPLTSTYPAVQHELTAVDSSLRIGCNGFDQASRNMSDCCCRRSRFKAHDRYEVGGAIRRHRAKNAHDCVGTRLKHDRLAVREIDKDFEPLGGRNPELLHRDWC